MELEKRLTQKILILKHPLSKDFLSVCFVRIGFGRVHPKVFQVSLRKCFLTFHRKILFGALVKLVLKKHLLIQDFRTGPGNTLRLSRNEIALQHRIENVPGADPNPCDLSPF